MNKLIYFTSLFLVLMLFPSGMKAQEYHEDDKEGLRKFLRQPSAEPGKINLEMLPRLALSDTLDWNTSEAWISKLMSNKFCSWSSSSLLPKRLTSLNPYRGTGGPYAGTLDCTLFAELTSLICSGQQLTRIIVNEGSKITSLNCGNNSLRFSTLPFLDLPRNSYYYFPQNEYSKDTIPVDQIIDLSSEYQVYGTNTVYEWIDEAGAPLTLSSAGNGLFKADAALVGKTISCKMTNGALSKLTLSYTVTLMPAQIYHADDKEGLRKFLRQPSAEPGKLNIEMLGLAISDTLGWNASEAWVDKLNTLATTHGFFTWNSTQLPQRLIRLKLPSRPDLNNKFAGVLDCTLFTELYEVDCTDHLLTQIIASRDSKIRTLNCQNNLLRFSTLPFLDMTYVACTYFPQKALPMYTIPVEGIIDLSSEYQINGINTVYEWISETGAPLTLSSLGNGIFKADAALGEGVIHCRMTNPIFPQLTVLYTTVLTAPVQIYHEDDKEGLRRFLRQTSFIPDRLNFEVLGLAISDTLNWMVSEAWVEKLNTVLPVGSKDFCSWSNDSQSKRLISLTIPSRAGRTDMFGGILDCTFFTELNRLICSGNRLAQIIANENSNISTLFCQSNALQFSTLPILDIPYYHYHSQHGQTDTIPVGEIIDLSSEYLINGANTVYEWVDEQNNNPLTLTSLGNGKFKADAALEGKIVTCKMTNQAFPNLTLPYMVILAPALPVQLYHEDDKEVLRRFLRQASAEPGKLNLEVLGLAISDTLNWETSEAWVDKLNDSALGDLSYGWGTQLPKKLSHWSLSRNPSSNNLAGILDCSLFTQVIEISCPGNQLTQIIAGENTGVGYIDCRDNLLRFSTLPLLAHSYHYAPQKALPSDTIPVTQVIDLSSEYMIAGVNTIYEWVDEMDTPVVLTSAGNGKFKAGVSLAGKTITCSMSNQRFPDLILNYMVTFEEAEPIAYHEDDKEGLRRFLRQASAEPGKLNLEALGLAISDTLNWETSDEWIEKLNTLNAVSTHCEWNNQQPKRLTVLRMHYSSGLSSKLAGILDCTPFAELSRMTCYNNQLTQIIASENSKISYINGQNNLFRFSTLPPLNISYYQYAPQRALPTDTIPVTQVIDLSSEYMINTINTVYQWVDETGAPLALTSAGNGMFKADTSLEGQTVTCRMTNQTFPDLTLEYKVAFESSSPEPEVITLVSHLTLEESPQKDYYVASSGERFKIFAQTLLSPDLVRIGLFKSNGGAWIEDITQSRSGYTYTCEISQTMPANNYMIQAYTRNERGDIQVIERKAQSFTIDKLPFAFVRNALLKYTPTPETMQSHLVLNSSAKNLYCLYIDNSFKVVVNIPVVGDTRIGLFDLFGDLVEDVTESVSGKLFTCRMSYDVSPGNYMLLPYKETAEGIQIVERAQGAAVMDRLPVSVDFEWNLRSAASNSMEQTEETEVSIYPNPVQNVLHVKANNTIERVEIYNLQGKVLKKVMQASEIQVTDLPTGTYVIRIYTNNTQTSRMFMKN